MSPTTPAARPGCYGLVTHPAPVDAGRYTVDVARLRDDARRLRPKLITIGGSLNLFPHPVRELRAIADEVGALLLYDAAHMSGAIAGRAWQQPLDEGAHVMTMSTYKSLGGPPAGLILTNEAALAERLDRIAYPGLTANFDAGKSAALAMALLDWKTHGRAYGAAMVATAQALAAALMPRACRSSLARRASRSRTSSRSRRRGSAAGRTRRSGCGARISFPRGIGLPVAELPGDLNGLRLGTNEIVRWGMGPADMPALARLIARALAGNEAPESLAPEITEFRRRFGRLRYIR